MSIPYAERWANPAWRNPVTVPAGAAAVAAGTDQWWELAGGWGGWPGLPPGGRAIMRVHDPHLPGEVIRAIELTAAGELRVIRGDQGTTPAAHPPGFRLENVITPAGLRARVHGLPSGNGVIIRDPDPAPPPWPAGGMMSFTPVQTWTGAQTIAERPTAGLVIRPGEAGPGAIYEAVAFGYVSASGGGQTVSFGPRVSGTGIGLGTWTIAFGTGPANAACRWRMHGWLAIHDGPVVCDSTEVELAERNDAGAVPPATVNNPRVFVIATPGLGTPVDLTVPVTWNLVARLNQAVPSSITVQGGRAWRCA
jgi:hypothetical protein